MLNNDNQKKNIVTMVSEVGDSETIVSEVLTFDEVVQAIAKDNNISLSEAAYHVESNYSMNNAQMAAAYSPATLAMLARAGTYRTIATPFEVTAGYKPKVTFYCQIDEYSGSNFRAIVKILNIGMDRSSNGFSKQFGGTVYANLETEKRIYWNVNGDFYDNGSTSVQGGVNIGIGQNSSVNFSLSYSSNHYKYANVEGYSYF
ncbi:MAG: hypothetical protein KID00_04060 [Clostridium argentinense]|uniref:Uncharacterized protein n=1 Tax=Clostridium faecium TaxID=2762223 RepID=A0ABR8YQI0_9CLOT|nr:MULTISPECIES: hypothetical protein [Clostridium]MBD8046498.1 hypothetical protein [Clostridium faecium]MBS5823029.1 hypothetical protein [Clostridium argentinense]